MLYFARWKITLVVAVCLIGLIFFAPNFLPRATVDQAPSWLPHEQISLGLDLQGGSHLLLEVDVGALIHERLETTIDSIRGALREDDIGYAGLGITDGAVQVAVRDPAQIVEARRLLNELNGPVGGGLL
ncbi:MAG: protein translocase subunit SecD, partial [Alphaproteobacteria bacterium]|nr:protein translocase subunit SecD [Alphaproteobacteria bacterium]